jgi:hypothetical protein
VGVQIRASRVTDQQCVSRQDEPGLLAPGVVRYEVGVVGRGVARRDDRPQLGVAELDDLAVVERDMLELHPAVGGHVSDCSGPLDQGGKPGHVVGLEVRLEDGDDRHALCLRERHVVVDQVDVRIHHGSVSEAVWSDSRPSAISSRKRRAARLSIALETSTA